MERKEFIEWLEKSSFDRWGESDIYWEELMDYKDFSRSDDLEVYEDHVVFSWDRLYMGGSETVKEEIKFEDFITRYNNFTLKD